MPPTYAQHQLPETSKRILLDWLNVTSTTLPPAPIETPTVVATATPTPESTPKLIAPINLTFGQTPIFQKLESKIPQISWIVKTDENSTTFALADGSSYAYDEGSDSLSYIPPSLTPDASFKTVLIDRYSGWRISNQSVVSFGLSLGATPATPIISLLETSIDSASYTPIHLSKIE